jgi:hypothetical protein
MVNRAVSMLVSVVVVACICLAMWAIFPAYHLIPLAFFIPGCFCCNSGTPCTHCSTGRGPDSYQVDIAGITNGSCGTCTNINASHILANIADCAWAVNINECSGSFGSITAQWGSGLFGPDDLLVDLDCTALCGQVRWLNTYGSTQDCTTVSGLSVTLYANSLTLCGGGSATATITAL